MTATVDGDLRLAQLEAIEASAWGKRFQLIQPRNPVFWLFVWALLAGTTRMVAVFRPGVANYGDALLAGAVIFGIYTIPWALFLHALDRYTGVSLKLVATGFLWGAIVATYLLALSANTALLSLYAKWFGQAWAADWSAGLTAPFTEETAKALGFLMLMGLAPHLIRSAYDAFIIGAFIGLGFQVSEDLLYVYQGAAAEFGTEQEASLVQIVVVRGVSGIVSHALFSAIFCTGLAWVIGFTASGRHVVRGIAAMAFAMFAHGVWDAAGAIGTKLFGDAGFVVLALIIVVEIAAVLLVARAASPNERRWIRAILAPEAQRGVVTEAEIDAVASTRRGERRYVKAIAGHHERKVARHVLEATHELAAAIAGAGGAESESVTHARAEVARLRSL